MPRCFKCNLELPDYHALAMHISTSKVHKRDRGKSKAWAVKYLMINPLSSKNKHVQVKPSGEQCETKRKDTYMTISGENVTTETICPKCGKRHNEALPVEFIASPYIWTIQGIPSHPCRMHAE